MLRHNKNKCSLEGFCNPEYVSEFLSPKEIQLTDTLICPRKSYFSCFLFRARRSSARRASTMTWRTIITDEKFLSLSLSFSAASFLKKRNAHGGEQGVPAGQSKESPSLRRQREMINQIGGGSWSPGNCLPIVRGTCYFGKSSLGSLPANFAGPYVRNYYLLPGSRTRSRLR